MPAGDKHEASEDVDINLEDCRAVTDLKLLDLIFVVVNLHVDNNESFNEAADDEKEQHIMNELLVSIKISLILLILGG